jgi:hypothetical protein
MSQKLVPRVIEQVSAVQGNACGEDGDRLAADDHANPQRGAADSAW